MRRNEKNMKWRSTASIILAGALTLTGCAATGPAEPAAEQTETVESQALEQATAKEEATTEEEISEEESASERTGDVMEKNSLETEGGEVTYFFYDAKNDGYDSNRTDIMSPAFYIFAGELGGDDAGKLADDLGIVELVQKWAGTVSIINPLAGGEYGGKDLDAFLELVNSQGPAKNVKVIGIENGGTFVNNYVSQSCYFVSGMFVYGGEMEGGLDYMVPVPVYLSGGSKTAVDYYTAANQDEPLAVVETGTEEDLKTAFGNAWDKVLAKTYRIYDWTTEFYSSNIMDHNTPYELNEIVDFDALGIRYITCKDVSVTGMDGAYSWFEYVPESILDKEEKTVPLVVSCHGNKNDPHIQGDTTGWPEMAAKEGFIVVSPEWQPSDINFTGCDGLGEDGVIALVGDLMEKYPQIDPSRVYISGLSAGGAFSFMMGIKHSDIFAAAAPVSGVNSYGDEIQKALKDYSGHGTPLLYICGDYDFFQMIPVDGSSPNGMPGVWESDPNVRIFSALQAYQKTLGLPVTDKPDMEANPYYGIALDNWKIVTLGDKQMYTGTLSDDKGVVMELGAILDQPHWNYKAEAEYIWNFFSRYARDTESGEIIVN